MTEVCGGAQRQAFSPLDGLPFQEGALREPNGLLALGGDFQPCAPANGLPAWYSRGFLQATPSSGGRPMPRGAMARITAYQP
ncbi:hypothetical protein ACNKHX_05215 [Shigella flexneri]